VVETFKKERRALTQLSWLVVGGKGQLGRALSIVLSEKNFEFQSLGSSELDIRSEYNCANYIKKQKPSVIINAAAWTDVDGAELNAEAAYAINAQGALNVAKAAKFIGATYAHVSTDYVFSGQSKQPWNEMESQKPISVYGKTKAAGEIQVLEEYSSHSYIFRTAWLYSSWGNNFAKTVTRIALFTEGEVRVVDDQIGQPTSAIDLANQIVTAIDYKLPFGIYHGTNSGSSSWYEFAQEIFVLTGKSPERVIPISSREFDRPAKRPSYSVLGHDNWANLGSTGLKVQPMQNWRSALKKSMPAIINAVLEEG
jgi:dTDP-4-dehydrorhamnose reductase